MPTTESATPAGAVLLVVRRRSLASAHDHEERPSRHPNETRTGQGPLHTHRAMRPGWSVSPSQVAEDTRFELVRA